MNKNMHAIEKIVANRKTQLALSRLIGYVPFNE